MLPGISRPRLATSRECSSKRVFSGERRAACYCLGWDGISLTVYLLFRWSFSQIRRIKDGESFPRPHRDPSHQI